MSSGGKYGLFAWLIRAKISTLAVESVELKICLLTNVLSSSSLASRSVASVPRHNISRAQNTDVIPATLVWCLETQNGIR